MSEFSLVPLVQLAEIRMGQSPDSTYVYEGSGQGVPFLQGNAEFGVKHPAARYSCTQPAKIADQGSSLISVRAPVGETNIADQLYCIGRGLAAVNFHRYGASLGRELLSFSAKSLDKVSQGTTFAAIGGADLRTLLVADIPNHEAKVLERVLDTLDTQIQKTEALIAKLEKVKGGLLHDLLTRGIDEHGQLRPSPEQAPELYKESHLGLIPREWSIGKLGQRLSQYGGLIQTGPFGSQLHAEEYVSEGIPVVMPQDMRDIEVSRENIAQITEGRAQDLARHRVGEGDLLFSRRGDLSRCSFMSTSNKGWLCGTGCLLLRPADSMNGYWLASIYKQPSIQSQVYGMAVGSTMVNLNSSILANVVIPLPALHEQNLVAEAIRSSKRKILDEKKCLNKMKIKKSGLMDDLLTGRVRTTPLLDPTQATTPA